MKLLRASLVVSALTASVIVAPSASAAAAPTISSVTVGLPTSADPAAPPSLRLPRVNIQSNVIAGCTAASFRYANEDGNWKTDIVSRTTGYIHPSPGYGYKGVSVQLVTTCEDGTSGPVGNIVYTRYTLAKPATDAPVVVGVPKITSVTVSLPTTADPAATPSQRNVQVFPQVTYPAGCQTMSQYRYANEDGVWKTAPLYAMQPYVIPTTGYGTKGVFVQMVGSCKEGGKVGPIGNVVYTKYTLMKPAAAPQPALTPKITTVTVSLPTTADPAAMPSQRMTQVFPQVTYPAGCQTMSQFRYANEDGVWKTEPIYSQRPYITPSPGYGPKGVYVQMIGSCTEGGKVGPIGNIVYTKYTLTKPVA